MKNIETVYKSVSKARNNYVRAWKRKSKKIDFLFILSIRALMVIYAV